VCICSQTRMSNLMYWLEYVTDCVCVGQSVCFRQITCGAYWGMYWCVYIGNVLVRIYRECIGAYI